PPSAALCQSEKKLGLYFNFYGLVWQSKEGSLEYAAKNKYRTDTLETTNQYTFVTPDFGWRPGFKLEAGYYLPFDNWDLKANWTCYNGEISNNKKHVNVELVPGNNGVVPIQFVYYLAGSLTNVPRFEHATGDLKIHFNSFDLDAGRYFWAGKRFSFRPYGGLKCGWIDQNYTVYYENSNLFQTGSQLFYITSSVSRFKNDSLGLGPKMGFEAKCHLKGNFQLLANGYFSLLPTRFNLKKVQTDLFNIVETGGAFHQFILKKKLHMLNPNIGLQLGFGYGGCFLTRYFLGLFLSYEMQYWWAQNQTLRFVSKENFALATPARGDLQLHGLSAYIKFEF
ncbi:MAG: Lpg1974 family pore-forming outer membrane protein, partial [Parachlamydiales bacterium]